MGRSYIDGPPAGAGWTDARAPVAAGPLGAVAGPGTAGRRRRRPTGRPGCRADGLEQLDLDRPDGSVHVPTTRPPTRHTARKIPLTVTTDRCGPDERLPVMPPWSSGSNGPRSRDPVGGGRRSGRTPTRTRPGLLDPVGDRANAGRASVRVIPAQVARSAGPARAVAARGSGGPAGRAPRSPIDRRRGRTEPVRRPTRTRGGRRPPGPGRSGRAGWPTPAGGQAPGPRSGTPSASRRSRELVAGRAGPRTRARRRRRRRPLLGPPRPTPSLAEAPLDAGDDPSGAVSGWSHR